MRLGAIFVALCMLLIAGSAGVTAHLGFGLTMLESAFVAVAVMAALGLYNAVTTRLCVRAVVGSQLTDLARGNADMARQIAEIGRRLVALEGRMDDAVNRTRATTDPLAVELGELGILVKQLADTVALHETQLAELSRPAPVVAASDVPAPAIAPTAAPEVPAALPISPAEPTVDDHPIKATRQDDRLTQIRGAIEANRIDLYLQPIVTLPQRKVRYYEAMSRLRAESGEVIAAADFVPVAEGAGLMPKIDNLVIFRCVQVVRRLLQKNRDIGLFCNLSGATLTDAAVFQQLLDFLDANRAIAPSVVLEFTQETLRSAGPIENESLSALADRGFRFSLDNLKDLRVEPRELSNRGFRFVKVPAGLLLGRGDTTSDIHPADLSDLLGRFGIDLVAEKIESEGTVVDLLDCDVRFGQGFLFSPPRPVRAEALQGIADRGDVIAREAADPSPAPPAPEAAEIPQPPRVSGLAQLARNIAGRN